MLDYKLLEAMAMVVLEGGFEKASRALHLTQSAVSQRVKLLEEQTGQILLARTSPPRATSAGQGMLRHYLQVKRLEGDLMDILPRTSDKAFTSVAVGINDDSLATWFLEAVRPFLEQESVLLDLRADDQEQTHRLLRDGEVVGCISSYGHPMQGCRIVYLGCIGYRLVATPEFVARWFPDGLSIDSARHAPAVMFNRKDDLHNKLFRQIFGEAPAPIPAHYVPSSEKFVEFITSGFAYGTLPEQQSASLISTGRLIELSPSCHATIKLYWHCWNLKSPLLEKLTRNLVSGARRLLGD
ncbi:MAG TPA: LysR family transcriptional regulator ArgP [Desulfobacterales bacterium]|nr:LysR family transcriptional regulator ArgP [Desulfobacterales bacterium]